MSNIIWPELPNSWKLVKIRDIVKVKYGEPLPKVQRNGEGKYPVYSSGGVTGTHDQVFINSPTIIIGRKGSAGSVYLVEEPCWCIDTAFYIDDLSDQVDIYFLAQLLKFVDLSRYIIVVGVPGLNRDDLYNVTIPIPPLEEQQRIVEILQQAEELRRLRQDSLTKAEKLASVLFLEMFGDPRQTKLPVKPLGKLGVLDRGMSKHRPRNAGFLFGGQYPFIQTGDVSRSKGFINSYNNTYSDAGLAQSKLWPAGTLCITIAANIANTGILEFDACFPDSVVGFIPNEIVTSEYVMSAISLYRQELEDQAPQAAQKNINLQTLRSLLIPVPSKHDLALFTNSVREIQAIVVDQEGFYSSFVKMLDSISRQAFSGVLTEKWRGTQTNLNPVTIKLKTVASAMLVVHGVSRPSTLPVNRGWLLGQLSHFQIRILEKICEQSGYLTEDGLGNLIDELPEDINHDQEQKVRKTLEQLVALGLIVKVSLKDKENGFVTAFRALREGDDSKGRDSGLLEVW